jgi:hypothetical protein
MRTSPYWIRFNGRTRRVRLTRNTQIAALTVAHLTDLRSSTCKIRLWTSSNNEDANPWLIYAAVMRFMEQ